MARCVDIANNGTLRVSSVSIERCRSYVIMDAAEWPGLGIWAMPSVAEATSAWAAGFTIPVLVFVVAAACRQILKMFD